MASIKFRYNITKIIIIKVIVVLAISAMGAAYTDVDDNLNIEDLIRDVSSLKANLKCYLDEGPCTEQNLGYKKHFMEAVNDGCRECNVREKHMFRVFLKGLKEKLPTEYEEFRAKYDPDNKHFDAAVAAIQKY